MINVNVILMYVFDTRNKHSNEEIFDVKKTLQPKSNPQACDETTKKTTTIV